MGKGIGHRAVDAHGHSGTTAAVRHLVRQHLNGANQENECSGKCMHTGGNCQGGEEGPGLERWVPKTSFAHPVPGHSERWVEMGS